MNKPKGVYKLKNIESFTDEVIIEILKNLDSKSLLKVCSVSKKMNRLCKDNYIWKVRYYSDISDSPPCLPPDWRALYKLAFTESVPLYFATIEVGGVGYEFHILGEDNLDIVVDQFLRDLYILGAFQFDDEDIETFHTNLHINTGDPSVAMIVDDEYEDDDLDLKIEIREIDGISIRSILNLFGQLNAELAAKKAN